MSPYAIKSEVTLELLFTFFNEDSMTFKSLGFFQNVPSSPGDINLRKLVRNSLDTLLTFNIFFDHFIGISGKTDKQTRNRK